MDSNSNHNKNSNQIFLSYRRSDTDASFDALRHFKDKIEGHTNLNVFLDCEQLRSGNFLDKLEENIRESYIFMPIVTRAYLDFSISENEKERDFCLFEYKKALECGKKIVPIIIDCSANATEVTLEQALDIAEENNIEVLKQYLLLQNGRSITSFDDWSDNDTEKLSTIIFDSFCTSNYVSYFNKHLENQAALFNKISAYGTWNSEGITLENSYVPLEFLRHHTYAEKEYAKNNNRSSEPDKIPETKFFENIINEKYTVIIGDAGQGKSTFAKKLFTVLAQNAAENGLSKDTLFPLYFECKMINSDSFSEKNSFFNELALRLNNFSSFALNSVLRYGQPLFIFDAMDEVSPTQMDKLLLAINKYLTPSCDKIHIMFTTRPGQKLVAGEIDMTLNNTEDTVVRRYTVELFNEKQRNEYIERLATAKKVEEEVKDAFLREISNKEKSVAEYSKVSRNPFILFSIFSTFKINRDLPNNRFDAAIRVVEDVISRDYYKNEFKNIDINNIKVILGAISYELYNQKDSGKVPFANPELPIYFAKELYRLDDADRDDRKIINEYKTFFDKCRLFDQSGFKHEFLASTYAAYYLYYTITKNIDASQGYSNKLTSDVDYWKSTTGMLFYILDKESRDSKVYLEPLLAEVQKADTVDYDLLCSTISQFTKHKARASISILNGMLDRGCDRLLETDGNLYEDSKNPYATLFYYPDIYPYLQEYLNNLTQTDETDDRTYIWNELIKEVQAVFSSDMAGNLDKVYKNRKTHKSYKNMNQKLDLFSYNHINGFICITKFSQRKSKSSTNDLHGNGFTSMYISSDVIQDISWVNSVALLKISVSRDNKKYHAEGNCLIETKNKQLILGCKNSVIPDDGSVTSIDDYAFSNCTGLSNIYIPNSITNIGKYAFFGCTGLSDIFISNSVTSIGGGAFFDCTGLSKILIPESVKSIGAGAFEGCTGISNIIVSTENKKYHSKNNCLIETKEKILVLGCKNSVIPEDDSVTSIGDSAFSGCAELKEISIPDSVTSIGNHAFSGCVELKGISIPDNVTSIGFGVFSYCTGLSDIIVSTKNKNYHSKNNCLIKTKEKVLVSGLKNSVIPDDGSVISIGAGAFFCCTGLKEISIPDKVTRIGDFAFVSCIELTSIFIPKSVKKMEFCVFANCENLTINYAGTEDEWNSLLQSSKSYESDYKNVVFKQI